MPNPDKNRGCAREPDPKITPEIAAEIESEIKHAIKEMAEEKGEGNGEEEFVKKALRVLEQQEPVLHQIMLKGVKDLPTPEATKKLLEFIRMYKLLRKE